MDLKTHPPGISLPVFHSIQAIYEKGTPYPVWLGEFSFAFFKTFSRPGD
jgi:hypothetical protein